MAANCYSQSQTRRITGFTLVELMVSLSIITIIVSTIVIQFVSFDNSTLLKTLAYDVAASVRTAQSYSVSVLGTDGAGFRISYGITFSPGATEYTFFRYNQTSGLPEYGVGTDDVEVFELGRTYTISEVCYETDSDGEVCDGVNRIDVSFIRPEYRAFFYADVDGEDAELLADEITKVSIKIEASRATTVGVVEIYHNGQVQVYLEES